MHKTKGKTDNGIMEELGKLRETHRVSGGLPY